MTHTRTVRSVLAAAAAGALVLTLAACSPAEAPATPEASATVAAPTTPTPTSAPASALSQDELTALFTQLKFPAGKYDTTTELLSSIYPGLTVSDASCLAPFGAGWEQQAAASDAAVEMATSTDRSMTAVVVGSGDAQFAAERFAEAQQALATCAEGSSSFELSGAPVELRLQSESATITGADEAVSWRATGEVSGSPFSLVGITALRGGTAIALVGWDPATNEKYVPAATQMFVDGF